MVSGGGSRNIPWFSLGAEGQGGEERGMKIFYGPHLIGIEGKVEVKQSNLVGERIVRDIVDFRV